MNKLFFFTLLLLYAVVMIAQEKPDPVSPVFDENILTRSDNQLNGNVYTDGFATLLESFSYGGNRLVALQNNDGGWDWPLDDGDPTNTSPLNTVGPIAMGLAQAYQQTGITTQNASLINAGSLLLSKTNNFSPSDGYLAAQLDKIFGVTTYTSYVNTNFYDQLAAGTYDRNGLGTLYTTASYVNLIRTSRSGTQANLAAWDIGMGLVGAAMCGASTTEWIAGVKAEIDELDGNAYYDVIGLAGAVYSLAFVNEDFDPTAGWHAAANDINDLAATLASYQITGGGFAWNQAYIIPNDGNETIQETAYAILALNEVNRTLYLTNIQGAANYIMNVQLTTGGWENYATSGENNEITAEALWGISVAYPAPVYNSTKDVYYPTIQGAIDDANSGNTILVAAGTYNEAVTIDKCVTLDGSGESTIISSGGSFGIMPTVGGISASERLLIKNLKITGSNYGIHISQVEISHITFENLIVDGCNLTGLQIQGTGTLPNPLDPAIVTDLVIDNCKFNNSVQYMGMSVDKYSSVYDLYIINSEFNGNSRGFYTQRQPDALHGFTTIDNVQILNTSFSNNRERAIYLEKLDNAVFDNVEVSGNGFVSGSWNTGLEINLKYADYNSITITNSTFTNNGSGNTQNYGTGINIKARDDGSYATNPASLQTLIIEDNLIDGNQRGIGVGEYSVVANSIGNVNVNNNYIINNSDFALVSGLTSTINAEYNWWGTGVESEIQALISGPVDYDPWIGKAEMVPVSQTTPTVYDFPIAGVKMIFSTLPVGGGNVTVQRYNEAPTPFPSGYTNVGMWLDITSTMPNYSFDVTVYVDVFGIPGFDATTTVMYYNSSTSSWMAIPGGTYLASDPMFGGHPSFSFVTNHFTPFTFINTPATAYDVYLSSSTSAASGFIYPNDSWGTTGYEPDDWDFTAPIDLYIVPEVGSVFGASDIIVQWDNTMFSYIGVDKTGGIYDNASSQFFTNQVGNQLTINAGRFDNTNITIGVGQYIAKLNLNLLKPGFGPVSFTALDFRAFDGLGGQLGVYVTGNNGQVKSYLGDVASHSSTLTGDGLVDFYDLTPWSISYWSGVGGFGMTYYKVKYDVGPTSDNTVYGLPTVDSKIQFEDLVIFAMSYGLSASHIYPKINAEPTEPVKLQLGDPIIAGDQTRIPLLVSGGVQNVRAMNLTFAGQFGKLVSVEKGLLLTEFTNPVMVMSNVDGNQVFVDLAVFGADELGINSEGEVLTLIFEGDTEINLNSANVRNILNGSMAVNISGSEDLVPADFALMQNYPNPFNPSTTINYDLPTQAMVEISIFNTLGERVATLVNEIKDAGKHTVEFNAGGYSSGIYFYQIKANDFVSVKKMILMK